MVNTNPTKQQTQPPAPLAIDPDKVCHLVILAREYAVKEAEVDPDSGSNGIDDRMIGVLEDDEDDSTAEEIRALISTLAEDEQVDVVTLLWLGRGDGTLEDWADLRAEARVQTSSRTAEYLLGQPLLADHLEEGLSAFGHSCLEFEQGRL